MPQFVPNPQENEAEQCPHCSNSPCLLYKGLYTSIVEHEEEVRASNTDITNKQVRFILYRLATNWIHGFLGRGVQIELPVCVRGEILDLAPEEDHVYTGFVAVCPDSMVE